jgi:glutathionylspermidine synthase
MQETQINQILKELCEKHNVPIELLQEMLEEERNVRHLKIRRGVKDRLRAMIEKSLGVTE